MPDPREIAKEVSDTLASPAEFARFCDCLAQHLHESQGELQSAHQDKGAGRVWGIAARKLEALAAIVRKES